MQREIILSMYLLQQFRFSTNWIKTIGGGGFNQEMVQLCKGTAFFTGSYTGTRLLMKDLVFRGSDIYLAEFDHRGNLYRLISHGGTMGDAGTAVALDNDGGIIEWHTTRQIFWW